MPITILYGPKQHEWTAYRIQTSIFFSPEQIRSRSSPVPLPDIAEIGSGDNLREETKVHCQTAQGNRERTHYYYINNRIQHPRDRQMEDGGQASSFGKNKSRASSSA